MADVFIRSIIIGTVSIELELFVLLSFVVSIGSHIVPVCYVF